MADKSAGTQKPLRSKVTLKTLAGHLRLSPATVSVILNQAPSAKSIPMETQDRVFEAAREYNYRPDYFAKSLRQKRTFTIGILAQDIGGGYGSLVLSGIEEALLEEGYFYFLASHHHKPNLLDRYNDLLIERGVEGIIAIDTELREEPVLPLVAVSGHKQFKSVTNVILDHDHAANAALSHLLKLGHRTIAFMKGQPFSSDSHDRWNAIAAAAKKLGIKVDTQLVMQLEMETSSPELGYQVTRDLAKARPDFTALFAYNDISAIGAIRALRDSGLRVPEDVSVIGFDDIESAAFHTPSLTTVRQPLKQMGRIAAQTLLQRIKGVDFPAEIAVEPMLIARESTTTAPVRG
jgi:DNA-binding LacI/PurR family transcriptional regulator